MLRRIALALVAALTMVLVTSCDDYGSDSDAAAWESLDAYYASIDYACEVDADCAIKDVGSCCGYYPECVNVDATVDSDFVAAQCAAEGLGGVCGYPSIDGCLCSGGVCQGTLGGEAVR